LNVKSVVLPRNTTPFATAADAYVSEGSGCCHLIAPVAASRAWSDGVPPTAVPPTTTPSATAVAPMKPPVE
jgi:hypothetical protein